ncbi:MAG TPA: aspartate/glutamate racemase family protein [Trebonia sp.]|jgi:allantoin racemase|nr:aspartate/glutamate racemase family protein [Trebonia sp.]
MRIAVVNCNTTAEMTSRICAAAGSVARPGTVIVGVTPAWGVAAAEGFADSFRSAASVLDAVAGLDADGIVLAGFGEHGREGVRQQMAVPVVDITEAAVMFACLLGMDYGIVTSRQTAIGPIRQSLRTMGLHGRCAGIRATGLPVLDIDASGEEVIAAFLAQSEALLADGAETIVLGCAGANGIQEALQEKLGVPVLDGVRAAVALCEDLVCQGLRTSKAGAFGVNPSP